MFIYLVVIFKKKIGGERTSSREKMKHFFFHLGGGRTFKLKPTFPFLNMAIVKSRENQAQLKSSQEKVKSGESQGQKKSDKKCAFLKKA